MPRPAPVRPAAAAAAGVATLATLALGATVVPAGAASTPAKTAQSEYQASVKAAGNQSVHFVSVVTQGNVTLHVAGDAGGTSGAQTLTVDNGKATEHLSAEVVGPNGYVNGNGTALQNVIGLSAAQSRKYAGHWLSFPTSNTALAQLVSGLLKSQVATELGIDGPFTFGSDATVNGHHATAVKGTVSTSNGGKVTEILYFPSSGTPLPIEEVTNPGASAHSSSLHGTVTFSNWGEKKSVKAPAHSMSILKLAPPSSSGATTTTGG
ncbi:MAG TPA: hypothetical protein VG346_10145 [Acidimicrobiales bacterium]|jgi:hypothetical protein|nr:hypothetical protein [Acidimicrobiales bacterium]